MRRVLPALVLVLFVACAGGAGSEPSSSPSPSATASPSPTAASPTASPTPSTTPSPTPEPDLQLPADASTSVDDPATVARVAAGDLAPLSPPGSTISSSEIWTTPADPLEQIALVWRRGEDPFAPETGLIVWQLTPDQATWRAVYAFTDRPRTGVLGIEVASGDLTGDGIADLLTLERSGGSGACGRSRIVAPTAGSAAEIFRQDACDTEIAIVDGALEIREAVFGPDDPHCCPSAIRTSTLEWDGERFEQTSSAEKPA
jgi:hypothetical protein